MPYGCLLAVGVWVAVSLGLHGVAAGALPRPGACTSLISLTAALRLVWRIIVSCLFHLSSDPSIQPVSLVSFVEVSVLVRSPRLLCGLSGVWRRLPACACPALCVCDIKREHTQDGAGGRLACPTTVVSDTRVEFNLAIRACLFFRQVLLVK